MASVDTPRIFFFLTKHQQCKHAQRIVVDQHDHVFSAIELHFNTKTTYIDYTHGLFPHICLLLLYTEHHISIHPMKFTCFFSLVQFCSLFYSAFIRFVKKKMSKHKHSFDTIKKKLKKVHQKLHQIILVSLNKIAKIKFEFLHFAHIFQ